MAKTDIGEFLASLRKSKGYTQQEAADLLGVSNKTVSNWETGASCPDISMLPALAEIYGVTCDEIVRGKRILAAEDEKTAEIKREKAMARLLNKHKTDLKAERPPTRKRTEYRPNRSKKSKKMRAGANAPARVLFFRRRISSNTIRIHTRYRGGSY